MNLELRPEVARHDRRGMGKAIILSTAIFVTILAMQGVALTLQKKDDIDAVRSMVPSVIEAWRVYDKSPCPPSMISMQAGRVLEARWDYLCP